MPHPLSALSYFTDLHGPAQAAVVEVAVRHEYDVDQVVFLEGEPCAGVYVVEEGWLKAVKTSPEGREQTLRFIGPGDVVNEIGVFADAPNPATVVALEPAAVWVIGRDVVLRLVHEHPPVARRVLEGLAERVLHLVSVVEDLSLRTVEERLARLLLESAEDGIVHRRRWATQTEIAARLGTVLDVLNRALQELARAGLIQVDRHQIRLLDPEGLRARAQIDR